MKISHSAIISPIFEKIKVVEFDIAFGENENPWTTRIELFQDLAREDYFRCHIWEKELFRLQPTFPKDKDNKPAHITDDAILVERPFAGHKLDYKGFIAPNPTQALHMIIDDLKNFLEHVTSKKCKN